MINRSFPHVEWRLLAGTKKFVQSNYVVERQEEEEGEEEGEKKKEEAEFNFLSDYQH